MHLFHYLSIVFISFLPVEAGFLLQSEFQKNYGDGSTTAFLTEYTYDNQGNRIDKSIFNGAETTSVLMSSTKYFYDDVTDKPKREILIMGKDTSSVVDYYYNKQGYMNSDIVFDGNHNENFRDSLIYDVKGNCVKKIRRSEGQFLFYHHLVYDSINRKIADTLFEPSDDSIIPSQATLFSYDSAGVVQAERNYRRSDTAWYPVSIVLMAYSGGSLSSVTEYDGDGSGKRMLDSIAFFFDINGNKIREQHFDDERAQVTVIDYTWILTSPVLRCNRVQPLPFKFSYQRNELRLVADGLNDAIVTIYDISGRTVRQLTMGSAESGKCAVKLVSMSPGKYIARIKYPGNSRSISFILENGR